MSLQRTDPDLGTSEPSGAFDQPTFERSGDGLPRRSPEPALLASALELALANDDVESLRPLLPVGYSVVAEAYRNAALSTSVDDLTSHYNDGLEWFHGPFAAGLKARLHKLSGGEWDLGDYRLFAAGSDVDLMAHVVNATAAAEKVAVYPGDWWGFVVGSPTQQNIVWDASGKRSLSCLCVPSVRHGHLDEHMLKFLSASQTCLLNLNLFPTLPPQERQSVSKALAPLLPKSLLSISFSRGFGLTASQLGVMLVHKDHPWMERFEVQWKWFTYFYNIIAARTFLQVDLDKVAAVDEKRRVWTSNWLQERGLPEVSTGTYYVKSFQVEGEVSERLQPLVRDGRIRLCLKPPIVD